MAPQTVRWLEFQPKNKGLFQEIREAVKVPIKFIHVVRNPFDIVGRITLRGYLGKKEELTGPVGNNLANQGLLLPHGAAAKTLVSSGQVNS